jgi:iron-regulated transporter 1
MSIHHINSPLNLTTVKEHGKLVSITNMAAIEGGGGPLLLQDSDTLVEETLHKLGEISASSNQDSDEAIQVFSSMSYNKRNLRKVGMKSTEVKVPSSDLSVLRHAPLNNESAGTWQLAPSDARVREYLIAQGLLSGKNPVVDREATKDDVFLKRHSRSLQLDDCKTSNDPQQNTNWKFTLCFLQILRCFGDRAWDFLLPVFIGSTVTQTLLPAAALDVFQTLGIVFLAPKIAMWYAERSTKGTAYVWLTFIKQIAITLLGALFVLGMPLLQEGKVNLMLPGVFGSILALTIASINTSLGNVVAKDWTAAFSKNSDELARANSMASASELAGAAAAPLCVRCLTGSFGFKSAFIILVLWQLATALISSVLALRLNRTQLKPSAALGTEVAPDESQFSFEQCRKLAPDVRGAIMATVLLWCTVLGGSGAGFTAWLSQRISLSAIAVWWSSMQFIGLIGASVAPALIKKLGSRKTARIAQTWQACFVLLAAVGFFTGRTILVLVAIAVSRLGVWCFDLAERQLVQEAVTASQRAPLFALETSASQCAHISILMVGLLFPAPSQFGILVALSATATTSACAILNTSLRGKRLSSPTAVAPLQSSPPHRLDIDAHRRHGVHLHSVRSRFDDLGEMRRAGQGDDGGADIYGDLGCEHVIPM